MKAFLRSSRISPRKANLIAKMVRGMQVEEALEALERTHKKAARVLERLLKSAIANAQHNDQQNAAHLVIKSLVVNKAQSYHRSVPMARGRVRPIRKFLSHIELTLGIESDEKETNPLRPAPVARALVRGYEGRENQKPKTTQDSSSKSRKPKTPEKSTGMASQRPTKKVKSTRSQKSEESGKGSSRKKKTTPTPNVSAEPTTAPVALRAPVQGKDSSSNKK